jgi:asparagine synthase (glutamine-hydrolysing)
MCGIAGFVELWASNVHRAEDQGYLLRQMCNVIRHRGPDDEGFHLETGVSLGMRRLSIIDLAGGHQPISGEDESVTIVFNGEIYNFLELKDRLEKQGHVFATNSDTEAIVHAYEEEGLDCVKSLRGMFALAIWDKNEQQLFLARDRVGKKPLYYTVTRNNALVFGSELKSLLEHPGVERKLSFEALDAYLTLGYVPDPLCIFENIYKLPPGHQLTFNNTGLKVAQYWDFKFVETSKRSEDEYRHELYRLLDESVRIRLVSDVPLGAFLSGGIDSSTVVALMAKNMSHPVKTFSIGFHEDSYNELEYARLTAKKYGTDHHEFFVTPEICDVVDELAWHFDEPFADSSAIPTYMVSKLAREHVTVILSGDGGDELFAGYTRYLVEQRRNAFAYVPSAVREGMMRPLSSRLPHGTLGRNFIYNVSLDPIDRYLDSVSIFTRLSRYGLYSADFKGRLEGVGFASEFFHEAAHKVETNSAVDRLLYIDSKSYLPGDILTKVDRMSMAVSLEARAPLLDHKLIDFVTQIPAGLKLLGNETKHILKRAVSDLVPAEILNRPKQGFGVPVQEWINVQLKDRMQEILSDVQTRQRGYFERSYVDVLLDEHRRSRRDHSSKLWALMMLELWHRQFLDDYKTTSLDQHENVVTTSF